MKPDDLIDLIDEAPGAHISDADTVKKHRLPGWFKVVFAVAACLAFLSLAYFLPRMGSASGGGAGGSGHEDGSVFSSYAGPVFPLTLREENTGISAQRTITMDFAPWIPVWISNEEEFETSTNLSEADRQDFMEMYNEWFPEGGRYVSSGDIAVTDSYVLTNHDTQDQSVRILYPFTSTLNGLKKDEPTLILDGSELETTLHAGSYSGGFQGAWENWAETGENPGSHNLAQVQSWEGYQSLLADGTYLQWALGDFSDLSNVPVTVYTFTDAWGPKEDSKAGIPNPSIRVMFEIDFEKTSVLSYGFHSGYSDQENGIMGRGFSIREKNRLDYDDPYYLIVIGDDIKNISSRGYVTGGWETKETVETGVTITRTESDLETALRMAAEDHYQDLLYTQQYTPAEVDQDFELYFGLLKEHLLAYGVLSRNVAARYADGSIEGLDVIGVSRVFWLETEILIPAGERVTLEAILSKEPSYDFYCSASENQGVSGYDMVTDLGSNLTFVKQTARLEDRGQIEIVRQNFGFDLVNGVNEVELDLTIPHYYLEVKSAPAQK